MADETNAPGTAADDSAIGTLTWSNVNDIKVDDTNTADTLNGARNNQDTHYLKATNFGFSIPSGATIDGIEVKITQIAVLGGAGSVTENEIKIVKADGSIGAENKSTSANIPTTKGVVTYGANNDLWSESWDDTDINDSDFGAVFGVNINHIVGGALIAEVYYVEIKVTYTPGAPSGGTAINIGDTFKSIAAMKINIADTWKAVAAAKINIGDSWKAVDFA